MKNASWLKNILLGLGGAIVIGACGIGLVGSPLVTGPPAVQRAIVDGVHGEGGNAQFLFLPPLVADPVIPDEAFAHDLNPTVTIARHGVDDSDHPALYPIAEYSTLDGEASEIVRVGDTDDHFIVNWHTNEFELDPDTTYRITVSVDGTTLGYADVDVVDTGKELKNVDTDEYIALKDNRTLPIKFWIGDGWDDEASPYPVEPDAVLEHDLTTGGVYKGVFTGSFGSFALFLQNGSPDITGYLIFAESGEDDPLTIEDESAVSHADLVGDTSEEGDWIGWEAGDAISDEGDEDGYELSGSFIDGAFQGEDVSMWFAVDAGGENPRVVRIEIPEYDNSDSIVASVIKETSDDQVRLYWGYADAKVDDSDERLKFVNFTMAIDGEDVAGTFSSEYVGIGSMTGTVEQVSIINAYHGLDDDAFDMQGLAEDGSDFPISWWANYEDDFNSIAGYWYDDHTEYGGHMYMSRAE